MMVGSSSQVAIADPRAVRSIRAPRDAASDLIGTTLIFSLMIGSAKWGLSNEAE
jgi:hypothetical protein